MNALELGIFIYFSVGLFWVLMMNATIIVEEKRLGLPIHWGALAVSSVFFVVAWPAFLLTDIMNCIRNWESKK